MSGCVDHVVVDHPDDDDDVVVGNGCYWLLMVING
jgi:hypothetical protein